MNEYKAFGIYNYDNVEKILNDEAKNGWKLVSAMFISNASFKAIAGTEMIFIILEKDK